MPQIDDEGGAAVNMAPALRTLEYPLSRELTVRACVRTLRGLPEDQLVKLAGSMTGEAERLLETMQRPEHLLRPVELVVCAGELNELGRTTARMRAAGIGCG